MTIALEQLADNSVADRNFQKLMRLVLDTGGQSVGIRFGTVALTFTGSTLSATNTVAHGLGSLPARAFFGMSDPNLLQVYKIGLSTTLLTAQARYNAVVTGTVNVDWLVIG